jgi:hypothetical protein
MKFQAEAFGLGLEEIALPDLTDGEGRVRTSCEMRPPLFVCVEEAGAPRLP